MPAKQVTINNPSGLIREVHLLHIKELTFLLSKEQMLFHPPADSCFTQEQLRKEEILF